MSLAGVGEARQETPCPLAASRLCDLWRHGETWVGQGQAGLGGEGRGGRERWYGQGRVG